VARIRLIASTMFWPCETRTSTCRSFATISSGLYRFLAIAVLLDVKDIPQVGPLQWGWISCTRARGRFFRVAIAPPSATVERSGGGHDDRLGPKRRRQAYLQTRMKSALNPQET